MADRPTVGRFPEGRTLTSQSARAAWLTAALLAPTAAAANAGSPLIWFDCFYLLFGNLLIGLFEAWLLRRRRVALHGSAMPILVGANYFSMAAGIVLLAWFSQHQESLFPSPLRSGLPLIVGSWAAAYLATIALEWPFVAWASRRPWLSWGSLGLSAWLQSASYAIMLPIALLASGVPTLFTEVRTVESPAEVGAEPGWVYFLDPDRPVVMRIRTDGSRVEKVKEIATPELRRRHVERGLALAVFEDSRPGMAHLKVGPGWRTGDSGEIVRHSVGPSNRCASPNGHGMAPTIGARTGEERAVSVWDSGWPDLGLSVRVDGRRFGLGAASPFVSFIWSNATILPSGRIVVQLERTIVMIDPRRRLIAELARGVSPLVALDP